MASEKVDLARAGTMQVTAQEGKQFLDKNLTEWKKPYLADHFDGDDNEEEKKDDVDKAPAKGKGKLAKHTTMKGTAKEAAALLGDDRPDPDAATRGQQKKLDDITSPPPAKKAKKAASADLKKATTIKKTLEEAKELYGDLDMSEGRSLRKRPAKAKPAAMKKAGTMQKTAKEGKAFLKRQKKQAKKADDKIEEENGDAEEDNSADDSQ